QRLDDLEHLADTRLRVDDRHLSATRHEGLARANQTANARAADVVEPAQLEHERRHVARVEHRSELLVELRRGQRVQASLQPDLAPSFSLSCNLDLEGHDTSSSCRLVRELRQAVVGWRGLMRPVQREDVPLSLPRVFAPIDETFDENDAVPSE